jgi:hypothetical protein
MNNYQKVLWMLLILGLLLAPSACARTPSPLRMVAVTASTIVDLPSMAMAWTVPMGTTAPTETQTPDFSPTDILPSVTPTLPPSKMSEIPSSTGGTPGPQEIIMDRFEFKFGSIQAWVKVVFIEDPAFSGFGSGLAMIYADSTETDLLWKSPRFDDVNEASTYNVADSGFGYPVLLIGWGVGMHGVRYYPIIHTNNGFQIPPIIGEGGTKEEGFFSDGSGVIPWPGGWILAGRRVYDGPIQSEIYVYRFDGKKYYLAKILTTEEELNNWIQSLTPTKVAQ